MYVWITLSLEHILYACVANETKLKIFAYSVSPPEFSFRHRVVVQANRRRRMSIAIYHEQEHATNLWKWLFAFFFAPKRPTHEYIMRILLNKVKSKPAHRASGTHLHDDVNDETGKTLWTHIALKAKRMKNIKITWLCYKAYKIIPYVLFFTLSLSFPLSRFVCMRHLRQMMMTTMAEDA